MSAELTHRSTNAERRRIPFRWILFGLRASLTLVILLAASSLPASPREAARRVLEGISHHRDGDFEAAEQSFEAAEQFLPDEPRVAFNRGCALAGSGDTEAAREMFQAVALARDPKLAASAHYNLGGLAAAEARQHFGPAPEETLPKDRPAGLELMAQAVQHYRDCIRLQPNHESARHNLELLRVWMKQMADLWERRDRERQREQLGLLQFLEMIEKKQHELRQSTRQFAQQSDTPQMRRAATAIQRSQQLLSEELEPLRDKIQAEFAQAAAGPSGPSSSANGQVEQAVEILNSLIDEAKTAMSKANRDLLVRRFLDAAPDQTAALERLNDIYRGVAPFEVLLRRATNTQRSLVEHSTGRIQDDSAVADQQELGEGDGDQIERQDRVGGWAEMLPAKAQALLQSLEAGPPPGAGPQPPNNDDDPAAAAAEQQARLDALKSAGEKAIESGPRIVELCNDASRQMTDARWEAALPPQQEALALLEEIEKLLPKQESDQQQPQDNQNQQDQPEQQEQNQDGQDQQKQDQKKQDQQKQDGDDQEQDQAESEKESSEEEKKSDSEQEDQQKGEDKSREQQQQPRQLSQEQAEALLRQARQRERDHRERQKALRRLLRGAIKVDKDW